jgi:RNA-directed DNA polymerase
VISPLLANIYMHRFLKHWFQCGMDEELDATVVNYADDFVILTQGHAEEALAWTRQVMEAIGLSLNEEKTCIRNGQRESFDFLGYTLGPDYFPVNGNRYLSARPSKKAIQRLKDSIRTRVKGNPCSWDEVVQMLNRKVKSWANYFSYGTRTKTYQAVNRYVYDTVVNFLTKRHKLSTQGRNKFPHKLVFGQLGVLKLET